MLEKTMPGENDAGENREGDSSPGNPPAKPGAEMTSR